MKIKQWIKIILVASSILALTACSHKRTQDMSVNDANAAYSDNGEAQSSGLGESSGFGDQASAGSQSELAKRTYYFDFDSDVIHDSDRPALNANANYLMAHPKVRVLLEGHTDPRGSREYNIALGERRAQSVARLLTSQGVSAAQIRVVSYGAQKLASPGHSESDYQQDRRVVLVYLR